MDSNNSNKSLDELKSKLREKLDELRREVIRYDGRASSYLVNYDVEAYDDEIWDTDETLMMLDILDRIGDCLN